MPWDGIHLAQTLELSYGMGTESRNTADCSQRSNPGELCYRCASPACLPCLALDNPHMGRSFGGLRKTGSPVRQVGVGPDPGCLRTGTLATRLSLSLSCLPHRGLLARGFTETHYLPDGTEVSLARNHTVSPACAARGESVLTHGSCYPEKLTARAPLRPERSWVSLREAPSFLQQSPALARRAGKGLGDVASL